MEKEAQLEKQADSVYDDKLSAGEVEQRLSRLVASPGGIQKIAQQMLSPLKRDLLYEGRIRQIFQTYKLALGEEAVFDADVDVPAASIAVHGLPEQTFVQSDRIRCETSPIAVKPLVRWNESNFRKFDILNRTQERAKSSVQFVEDSRGYALIKFASGLTNQGSSFVAGTNNPTIIADTSGRSSQDKITEAIVTLRSKLLPASKIWVNPFRTKDYMLFNTVGGGVAAANGGFGIFAPNFQEQLLKAGRVGALWGVEVAESIVVPSAEVFVLAPSDYLGVLAVRTDISVETLKDPNQFADVFAIWEDVGFVIRFAKGIVRIDIS